MTRFAKLIKKEKSPEVLDYQGFQDFSSVSEYSADVVR